MVYAGVKHKKPTRNETVTLVLQAHIEKAHCHVVSARDKTEI